MRRDLLKRMLMVAVMGVGAGFGMGAGAGGAGAAGGGAMPASNGPAAATGEAPVAPMSDEVKKLIQMLHDRRNTLKDFTAKAEYSVYHPVTDEASGKAGDINFIMDADKGPTFSVDFTERTDGKGKVVGKGEMDHQEIVFDGVNVLVKDFGPKQYIRTQVLPEGGKPGDATSLNGKLTIPIGIDAEDVAKHFVVTVVPKSDTAPAGDDGQKVTLHLVPRTGSKFDFKQMDITIDRKLELPVEMMQVGKDKDVTTIKLTEIQTNTGKAKLVDAAVPAGWMDRNAPATAPASAPAAVGLP